MDDGVDQYSKEMVYGKCLTPKQALEALAGLLGEQAAEEYYDELQAKRNKSNIVEARAIDIA